MMSSFVLLSLLLVTGCRSANIQATGIDAGIDRPGGDIKNMPIILDSGSSPGECQLLCASRRTCQAWAYDSCGKRNCWLKNEIKPQTRSRCRVSLTFWIAKKIIFHG